MSTICLSYADFSPMRSSFVNDDCPSLLSTVIVSLSRSIYLPALRSTVVTRFIATMADSDFHRVICKASCFALALRVLSPSRTLWISWVQSYISINSPTPATPVGSVVRIPRLTSHNTLWPATRAIVSAPTTTGISELSRSPFGFGSSISLSTLCHFCYRQQRKARYTVELVLLP